MRFGRKESGSGITLVVHPIAASTEVIGPTHQVVAGIRRGDS